MFKPIRWGLMAAGLLAVVMLAARAEPTHQHTMHDQHEGDAEVTDNRALVTLPQQMRIHTLANMRDHLLSLQEIQTALAEGRFDQAGEIAEQRLGMTSLESHGAHEVGQFMPEKMRQLGTEMHRAASRFAVVARDAGVEDDVKPALAALSRVTRSCVACHSAFRYQ
ncbi:hypothetical protein [Thiohalophilus sp.]|uniref:hypothetical protein n=1 Tax=Thiohalophilus sp. TaxID=3028392 RepID=UPI002ACEE963|nr:hypothetical protein [Thiohalophilus sp.]MDZ7663356.1 hypothetical protein [Thiohalophilus sp.]